MDNVAKQQSKYNFEYYRKKPKSSTIDKISPYLFLLPAFIIFGVFLFFPLFKTIYLSLSITNKQGIAKKVVFFRNYIRLFEDESFWRSIITTFKFGFGLIIGGLSMGLATSVLCNQSSKGFAPFKIIFSMPMAIAASSAALVFQAMVHPSFGLLKKVFKNNINWLTDPKWALLTVTFCSIWIISGTNYIFFSAGIKNIPKDLYESADIDGAGFFSKFKNITLPLLSPVMFFMLTMDIILAFQSFAQIRIMTKGGPSDITNVLVYSIYKDAFENTRFDLASAKSIILFLIILLITRIQFLFEKRSVFYK